MSYSYLPKKWPVLIKDHFDPNQDYKILHVAVSACMCACVFMCLCVCVCVRVFVYMKKDFKNTMQKKILKEQKFPYLKTFTLLEDNISVFQYWVWISTPSCIRKEWFTKNISKKILKGIEKRKFNFIIISHLNINSIKRRFGLL